MCVELLIGFRTHCSWSMQGLFFTFFHFYRRQSKDRDSLFDYFGFQNKSKISPTLLPVEVFERTASAKIRKKNSIKS